ncbi:MAG: hypothetical protein PHP42_01765 [Bacteroidota bacterium]|nr:hypothetical protein [Bacteroidota bacterium]
MKLQTTIFVIWIISTVIVIAAFVVVYLHSKVKPSSITYEIINSRRFKFFYIVVILFLALFFVALSYTPYTREGKADEIIGVKARMFSFVLTKDTVDCGKLIEFRVAAEDVTHGFGMYDSAGTLLGQVQAMPGYINRLRIQFDTPGKYNIFCLEYCGSQHHQMKTSLIVK